NRNPRAVDQHVDAAFAIENLRYSPANRSVVSHVHLERFNERMLIRAARGAIDPVAPRGQQFRTTAPDTRRSAGHQRHAEAVYSSRVTLTVTSAVTSRCRRTVTLCSPSVRIGSSSLMFRRSTL